MWKWLKRIFHRHNYIIRKSKKVHGNLAIGWFSNGPATMLMCVGRCNCGKWNAWMEGSVTGLHLKNLDFDETCKELNFNMSPYRCLEH